MIASIKIISSVFDPLFPAIGATGAGSFQGRSPRLHEALQANPTSRCTSRGAVSTGAPSDEVTSTSAASNLQRRQLRL